MMKDPNAEVDIKRTEYWIGVVIKYIMSLKPCLITGLVVAVLMTLINYYRLLGRVKMRFHYKIKLIIYEYSSLLLKSQLC